MTTAQVRAQAIEAMTQLLAGAGMDAGQARGMAAGLIGKEITARRAQEHARGWDGVALDLATVLEFYNPAGNPGQPRNPKGQPGGGQFTKGQGQQQGKGKKPAKGKKPPAKGKPKPPAHSSAAAARAKQKANLLATAKADRTRAAGILKQITALQKIIANAQHATGKTINAKSNVTKSNAPAKQSAATPAAGTPAASAASAAKTASSASSTASSTASKTASATAAATAAKKRIGPLQQQYKTLMHQAAVASAQAAKL